MLRTILLLIGVLIALPVIALEYDQALSPEHWEGLRTMAYLMLAVALTCFVVSEATRNYSQVDKLWSILPAVYAWYFAWRGHFDPRMLLMAALVTIWAARLTYNFARRGGYHWLPWLGEEDYRWGVLRKMPLLRGRLRWTAFNLAFISLYQNSLILLFTLPMVVAWQGAGKPLNWLDFLAAALMLGFIAVETMADQQQYDFQTEKWRRRKAGEPLQGDYGLGFRTSGLWGLVRHPNYAAEQAIWLSFYLFGVAATSRWLNWSLAGAVLLMLLFLGSSDFSERISSEKYRDYRDYQQRVPRFVPRLILNSKNRK
jgi:steroid 5-alpha reductase family enzyme